MSTKILCINGKPTQLEVTVAASFFHRLRGLMGKKSVSPLLLPSCGSIHTFCMRCAIDAVFLDHEHRIVKIDRAIPPGRVSVCIHAQSVLELPAGVARELSLSIGDTLDFSCHK